jgi:hypothetical protein
MELTPVRLTQRFPDGSGVTVVLTTSQLINRGRAIMAVDAQRRATEYREGNRRGDNR